MYETHLRCLRNSNVSLRIFSVGTLCSKCFYTLCYKLAPKHNVPLPSQCECAEVGLIFNFGNLFFSLCSLMKLIIKKKRWGELQDSP